MSQHRMNDPQSLGRQHSLGNYRATYKPLTFPRLGGCAFMLSALLLLCFLYGWISHPSFSIPILFLGSFLALVTFLSFIVEFRGGKPQNGFRVFIYDLGLIHIGHESIQTIIYWQDVQEIWHEISHNENSSVDYHSYSISCVDGTSLTLNATFMNREQLREVIVEETGRYLFDAAYRTYQTGQPVVFGCLTVTFLGLYHETDLLPWSEIGSIKFYASTIEVRKRGERADFSPWVIPPAWAYIKDIPNIEALYQLIRRIKPEALGGVSILRFPTKESSCSSFP